MKKYILSLAAMLLCAVAALAQNDKADNIIGRYVCGEGSDAYKVKISKEEGSDTYKCQIYWVANILDEEGNISLDTKNPDKSLRSKRIDEVVLFTGLKYNAEKACWDGTKIYDPNRGIRVKATISFADNEILKVRGTVLGIGETVIWQRVLL